MLPLPQVKKIYYEYFLEALEETMNSATLKNTIFVGNLNSQIEEREEYEYNIMGPYTYGKRNIRGGKKTA